jgi:hypothetical protein
MVMLQSVVGSVHRSNLYVGILKSYLVLIHINPVETCIAVFTRVTIVIVITVISMVNILPMVIGTGGGLL